LNVAGEIQVYVALVRYDVDATMVRHEKHITHVVTMHHGA